MERHGRVITDKRSLFGHPIEYELTLLDQGIHVLLAGGAKSHIGAISVAEGEWAETKTFSGHKDHLLSEPWAKAIAQKTGQRCAVICGIHYDGVSKADIAAIVAAAEELLAELLRTL